MRIPFWILHPPSSFSSSSYNLYTVAVLFSTRCSECLYIVNQLQIYCSPNRSNVLKQLLREKWFFNGRSFLLFLSTRCRARDQCGWTGLSRKQWIAIVQECLGYVLRIKNYEILRERKSWIWIIKFGKIEGRYIEILSFSSFLNYILFLTITATITLSLKNVTNH